MSERHCPALYDRVNAQYIFFLYTTLVPVQFKGGYANESLLCKWKGLGI